MHMHVEAVEGYSGNGGDGDTHHDGAVEKVGNFRMSRRVLPAAQLPASGYPRGINGVRPSGHVPARCTPTTSCYIT
jgi:hypothetical protein